jgi:hypothetical protein
LEVTTKQLLILNLEGGILEAFAKLFPDNTRLYIYPYKSPEQDDLVTTFSHIKMELC